MDTGVYSSLYLPITIYRPDRSVSNNFANSVYHFEKDSPYYLFSPKTLVALNKIHAYYLLSSEENGEETFDDIIIEKISEVSEGLPYKSVLRGFGKPERKLRGFDVSTWLRPYLENSFTRNDDLYPELLTMAKKLNYDCLVFLREPSFYRTDTEVLDVRSKLDSIKNIVLLE